MGFFSSRRTVGESQSYIHNDSSVSMSVVQVIRTRFYGKYKGKARETHPPSMTRHSDHNLHRLSAGRSPLGTEQFLPPQQNTPRTHTDVITATLAQRLDELAAANSQGLLDDDEYRLLRQNIFERLASGSSVPQEAPLVPIVSHPPNAYNPASAKSRSPSVRSKSSISSAMSTLFKRSSRISAHTTLTATTDDTSIFSGSTSRRPIPPHMRSDVSLTSENLSHTADVQYLGVNGSTSSINIGGNGGRSSPYRSLRRLQTGPATPPPSSFRLNSTTGSPFTPVPSTSTTPHTSSHSPMQSHALSLSPSTNPADPENLSSLELKRQIATLEAEGGRLLDAFNGLELTALTRRHPPRTPSVRRVRVGVGGSDYGSRGGGSEYGGRGGGSECEGSGYPSTGRGTPCEADAQSMYSASAASSVSQPRSQPQSYRNPSLRAPPSTLSASARKRSMSSISSRARVPTNGSMHASHSSPGLTHSKLRELGSVSSVNLARDSSMHLPSTVHNSPVREVPDDDASILVLESELGDIRRRRGEVTARYQARLEYLRAQLRGAELREKLMRR
ncbi:hypothetical protein DEU56DRAFT_788738 [Suillus clintonianus]|uniref:uncharacterized protein n=1 Tax=Suillus clintonianus TaxID=1904413 RepID=UPI001B8869B6|nr:uncharacterized protein DEU56DRAFT_788738 [Suillus clintonianus]KAG2145905.1 hypothetical protein DEU56DRAFT_788738 [Suillus clintonianus]